MGMAKPAKPIREGRSGKVSFQTIKSTPEVNTETLQGPSQIQSASTNHMCKLRTHDVRFRTVAELFEKYILSSNILVIILKPSMLF